MGKQCVCQLYNYTYRLKNALNAKNMATLVLNIVSHIIIILTKKQVIVKRT